MNINELYQRRCVRLNYKDPIFFIVPLVFGGTFNLFDNRKLLQHILLNSKTDDMGLQEPDSTGRPPPIATRDLSSVMAHSANTKVNMGCGIISNTRKLATRLGWR